MVAPRCRLSVDPTLAYGSLHTHLVELAMTRSAASGAALLDIHVSACPCCTLSIQIRCTVVDGIYIERTFNRLQCGMFTEHAMLNVQRSAIA